MNDSPPTPREAELIAHLISAFSKELAQTNMVLTAVVRATAAQPGIDTRLLLNVLREEEQRLAPENVSAKNALKQLIANGEGSD